MSHPTGDAVERQGSHGSKTAFDWNGGAVESMVSQSLKPRSEEI